MNEQKDAAEVRDRRLGDEWEDWTGDLDESTSYRETAVLFTALALVSMIVVGITAVVVLYLVEPRLELLHPGLVIVARMAAVAIGIAVLVWGVLLVVGVSIRRNLFLGTRIGQTAVSGIFPMALAIARWCGISRDRLGNSFVAFSNAIIAAGHHPGRGKTIILLPRCLRADVRKDVQELAEGAGVGVHTVSGGGQARRVIRDERPSAVIGVACERDLISGIRDVAPLLPTIGITNQRPEGPCKNTLIDMDALSRAIETFTGESIDSTT